MLSQSFRRATGPALLRRISVKPAVSIPTFAVTHSRQFQSLSQVNPRHQTQRIPLSRPIQVRNCSAHRKMCRGTDNSGAAVQVPDREILPTNVKALHYDLTLEPNFKDFTFDGVVDIE